MDFKDNVVSDFRDLSEWRRQLWSKISDDANAKGAFPVQHFDDAGLIKAHAREYHRLFDWLNNCKEEALLEVHEPMWEYKEDNLWELYFVNTDDWLYVRPLNDQEAIALKPGVRRKLGRGGMVVKGLKPKNGFGDDIDIIEKFETIA